MLVISGSPRTEGFKVRGDLNDLVVVEIEPGDRDLDVIFTL
jgi:hypothetical protein